MKNIKYLWMLSCLVLLFSCKDDAKGPVLTFEKGTVGGYPRIVDLKKNEFDLANLSTSTYEYDVDFVDEEDGALTEKYEIFVQYLDKNPSNGDKSAATTLFKTYQKSEFTTSANGNPGVSVVIPLSDLLSQFGLTADDLIAGDEFSFTTQVTVNGSGGTAIYRSTNSAPTIRGAAFKGFFDNVVKATCPLPDDLFVGSYTIAYEDASGPGGYGLPFDDGITVDVSTVAGSTTKRTFSVVYLPGIGGYGPYPATFDFVCDKVEFIILDSDGLGCGDGGINCGPWFDETTGEKDNAAVDISDDSSFSLIFDEGFQTGGCASIASKRRKITLTKN